MVAKINSVFVLKKLAKNMNKNKKIITKYK